MNSIKTYIFVAYRKMGVTKRTEAVIWGIDNGFRPDTLRTIDPALSVSSGVGHRSSSPAMAANKGPCPSLLTGLDHRRDRGPCAVSESGHKWPRSRTG